MKIFHVFDTLTDECVPYDQLKSEVAITCVYVFSIKFLVSCVTVLLSRSVIHTHHKKSFYFVAFFLLPLAKSRVFHTVHNPPENYSAVYIWLLSRYCPRNVVFNSQQTRSLFEQADERWSSSAFVNNGVKIDTLKTYRMMRSERGASDEFRVLFCGRLVPQKNFHVLLTALTTTKQSATTDIRLQVVAPEKAARQYVSKMGYKGNVEYLDTVSQRRLWRHVAEADIVVVPSLYEGYGNFQMEAAIISGRLLLSDIPIHREFYNSNCFFQPNSPEQLSNIIGRILLKDLEPETLLVDEAAHDRERAAEAYRRMYGV